MKEMKMNKSSIIININVHNLQKEEDTDVSLESNTKKQVLWDSDYLSMKG